MQFGIRCSVWYMWSVGFCSAFICHLKLAGFQFWSFSILLLSSSCFCLCGGSDDSSSFWFSFTSTHRTLRHLNFDFINFCRYINTVKCLTHYVGWFFLLVSDLLRKVHPSILIIVFSFIFKCSIIIFFIVFITKRKCWFLYVSVNFFFFFFRKTDTRSPFCFIPLFKHSIVLFTIYNFFHVTRKFKSSIGASLQHSSPAAIHKMSWTKNESQLKTSSQLFILPLFFK